MSNKSDGNHFEYEFAHILSENGWWVHLLTQNKAGQPADVIAAKHGKTLLIDCKVCSGDRFPLSRVEDNQDLAMTKWSNCGNGTGWFALKTPMGKIWMLPHHLLSNLIELGASSIPLDDLSHYGTPIERWLIRRL